MDAVSTHDRDDGPGTWSALREAEPLPAVVDPTVDRARTRGRGRVARSHARLDRRADQRRIGRLRSSVTNAVSTSNEMREAIARLHKRPNAFEIDRCRWWQNLERAIVQAIGHRRAWRDRRPQRAWPSDDTAGRADSRFSLTMAPPHSSPSIHPRCCGSRTNRTSGGNTGCLSTTFVWRREPSNAERRPASEITQPCGGCPQLRKSRKSPDARKPISTLPPRSAFAVPGT